jgi:FkbM family methyltransferase
MLGYFKRALTKALPSGVTVYREILVRRRCTTRGLRITPYGFRLAGNAIMSSADFEVAEARFVLARMRQASVFVDIGANVGFYSCLARQVGARVIAVEPCPEHVNCLLFNLTANGWNDVEVLPIGLADCVGVATIYGAGTGASLLTNWAGATSGDGRLIPISTLDTILGARFASERLLVKVDVEGAELRLLNGAEQVLARRPSPIWLVEICLTENHAEGMNPDFERVFQRFWAHGYMARGLLLDGSERQVTPEHVARWVETRRREFGYVSYVFQRTDTAQ